MPGSKIGLALMRVAGFVNGNSVADSSVYLDGHTLQVDVMGNNETANALQVRRLAPSNNLPTQLMALDKTGALSASLLDSGGQVINVLSYAGVDRTGVTSSSAGIQAALNAAAGTSTTPANVYVPAGRYLITTPLVMPEHTRLFGPLTGRGNWWGVVNRGAVFVSNTNGDILQFSGTGIGSQGSTVEGITFDGTGAVTTGACVNFVDGCNNMAVRHCSFQGKDNGVIMNGTTYILEVEDCFFQGNTGASARVLNNTGTGGHTLVFKDNWFRAGTGSYAIQIGGSTTTVNVIIDHNIFDTYSGANAYNIYVQSTVTRATVRNNWFEGTNGVGCWGIYCTQGAAWTIGENYFTNVTNGMRLALFTGAVISPNRFSTMSGNSILIPNDGSGSNVILPQTDASTGGISDASNGTFKINPGPGLTIPVTAVGPGGAAINLGSNGIGAANPRIIFYDDTGSASYVSEDVSGQLHIRATGQMIFDIMPTGATRFSATPTPALTLNGTTVVTPAGIAAGAGLNIPHGVAPTAPVNGDIWTTTAGAFIRINGVTRSINLT